jgi:DNA-binding MarR family transcriptional regulator
MTTTINGVTEPSDFFLQLAQACAETRRAFDRSVGMGQARRQLLVVLDDDGEVSHAALAGHLGIDGAAVTRHVKALELAGFVRRRLDPDDNRYTLASLTGEGRARVAELRAAHEGYQGRLLAGVDPTDVEAAVRALARVRANIRAADQAPAGVLPAPLIDD